MQYNVDLLFAGWLIALVIALHILVSRHNFRGMLPRLMGIMVFVALLDNTADILASRFISNASAHSLAALYGADVLLYVAQASLTFLVFVYTVCLCGELRRENAAMLGIVSAPFAAVELLIVTTPLTGLVFAFDPATHAYSYGLLQPVVYFVSLFYGACVGLMLVRSLRFLRKVDVWSIALYFAASIAIVVYQMLVPEVPIAGFVASLCLMFIYASLCSPTGLGDTDTGVFGADEFRRRVASHIRFGVRFDIVFVSLTNRRYLNEVAGVEEVDGLLADMARQLMRATRSRQVYRLFGSHFAAIAYSREQADATAEQMRAWLSEEHVVAGRPLRLGSSVSCIYDAAEAVGDVDLQAYAGYIASAGDAAGAADGPSLVEGFRSSQESLLAIERAIAEDAFWLCYQPILDTATGRFSSLEALSRLSGPNGPVPPAVFIPQAEEAGLIADISRLQFSRLCRFAEEFADELSALGVSDVKYNLSALEFSSRSLGPKLLGEIAAHGLDPGLFTFEVTETAVADNEDVLRETVECLRSAGCRVYLDDFGSGYANLATVMKVPFDGVKLDMSLLRSVEGDGQRWSFYCELVDIMQSLGKKVVSEGVETKERAAELIAQDVDYLQGFAYSRPLPPAEVLAFLARASA